MIIDRNLEPLNNFVGRDIRITRGTSDVVEGQVVSCKYEMFPRVGGAWVLTINRCTSSYWEGSRNDVRYNLYDTDVDPILEVI